MATVRAEDYYKAQLSATQHCEARGRCPLSAVCGRAPVGQQPLQPTTVDCTSGELFWTNQPHGQHVIVMRSGLFVTMGRCSDMRDTPCGLLGSGDTAGIPELYTGFDVSDTYYLRALTTGQLCVFPARALRRHLEALPGDEIARIISCALTNTAGSAFALIRVMSRTSLYDRAVSLFVSLRELLRRESSDADSEIGITHDDVAMLINANRSSVSRVLSKMANDGLIELGYKLIRIDASIDSYKDAAQEQDYIMMTPDAPRIGTGHLHRQQVCEELPRRALRG